MLSKSGRPAGTPVHFWIRASGVCSYSRSSAYCACSVRSHDTIGSADRTRTRSGSVLMQRPTSDSTPSCDEERPDTVTPKRTSRSWLYRLSTIAHAAATIVASDTP